MVRPPPFPRPRAPARRPRELGDRLFQALGYAAGLSGAELKTLQEVITLAVFVIFAFVYLKEPIRWNTIAGFALIALGATFIFAPWAKRTEPAQPPAVIEAPTIHDGVSG